MKTGAKRSNKGRDLQKLTPITRHKLELFLKVRRRSSGQVDAIRNSLKSLWLILPLELRQAWYV